jgi:carotenoid 1,2-hydratase
VAWGGYLWWYVDAISDDGQQGLSLILFVGSVFSPYYALARKRHGVAAADPDQHCALNVALYGQTARRWTMTERGSRHCARNATEFKVGPSRVWWDGQSLCFDIDEWAVPLPQRVRGRVRVHPQALCSFVTALDANARHRWGPIAPCARVEVDLQHPATNWRGHAYLDSNEGDEPVASGFKEWDWSRAVLSGGDTAVIYDVRPRVGPDRVIAQRFTPDGGSSPFEPPPRQPLARSKWLLPRTMRTEPGSTARVEKTLEDTPFYVRSLLSSGLLGERVTSVHETLDLARLVSLPVQLMLPWRMPRRG